MRAARAAAGSHALLESRLRPVSGWLRSLDTPLSRTVPVVRSVPVLSIAMAGAGTAVDVHGGMDPTHAVVKNAASTGAGLAAGTFATGVAATALTGGAVAAAPVVIGVAAGAAVGYGVGWVVGEYGDDVWDEVVDVGVGAKDLAGRVWGSLTG
jgi:xanthine/uracil permease